MVASGDVMSPSGDTVSLKNDIARTPLLQPKLITFSSLDSPAIDVSNSSSSSSSSLVGITDLTSVLLECFTIILIGYLSGRLKLITEGQSRGLGAFVTYFALPALIFTTLATTQLSDINWSFVAAIFLSKTIMFIMVVSITSLLTRPLNFGKSGLFGIFCTQSNDFALGYPLIDSLYRSTHPLFARYLYVLAPIQLLILNPIGIFLMEVNKCCCGSPENCTNSCESDRIESDTSCNQQRSCSRRNPIDSLANRGSNATSNSVNSTVVKVPNFSVNENASDYEPLVSETTRCKEMKSSNIGLAVLKGMFKNPIIVTTVLGLAWNLICGSNIPDIVEPLLNVLSQAFSATALFLLGLNMVGNFQLFRRQSNQLLLPLVLITMKILVLPLIIRLVTLHITNNDGNFFVEQNGVNSKAPIDTNEDLANFGFLYGTIPVAPTVFIFALQYDLCKTVVAAGMVISTLLSAPLMFVSANIIRMAGSGPVSPKVFEHDLGKTMSFVGLISSISLIWVLIVFLCGKRWHSVTHKFTICLSICQLVTAIGGYLWQYLDITDPFVTAYFPFHLQYVLAVGGLLSCRIWTAFLAVILALLHYRSLCFVLRLCKKMTIASSILSGIVLALVIYVPFYPSKSNNSTIDPNFEYGTFQAYIALAILLTCLTVTVISLILQQHFEASSRQVISINVEDVDLFSDNDEDELMHFLASPVVTNNNGVVSLASTSATSSSPVASSSGFRRPIVAPIDIESSPTVIKAKKVRTFNSNQDSLNVGSVERPKALPNRKRRRTTSVLSADNIEAISEDATADVENLLKICNPFSQHCRSAATCPPDRQKACFSNMARYQKEIGEATEATPLICNDVTFDQSCPEGYHQVFSHIVLLMTLSLSMIIGLVVTIGKLVFEKPTGIFVELEFLDILLNYGQGIVTFLIFGLDPTAVFDQFSKLLARYYTRRRNLRPNFRPQQAI